MAAKHYCFPMPCMLGQAHRLQSSTPVSLLQVEELYKQGAHMLTAAALKTLAPVKMELLSVEAHGEEAAYNAPASLFESTAHCLHGVLHLNGYGHLVGGAEGRG